MVKNLLTVEERITRPMFVVLAKKLAMSIVKQATGLSENFFVSSLDTRRDSQWLIQLGVNGRQVRFKIDTGASCNLLPWNVYCRISKKALQPGPNVCN